MEASDFLAQAMPIPHCGCFIWTEWQNKTGYGQTRLPGQRVPVGVHRLVYELTHGVKLRSNQFVCHRCDVPSCINPDHLFIGDHSANMRDRNAKGRGNPTPLGERHAAAKLKESDALEIFLLRGVVSEKKLAARFGVSHSAVRKIHLGHSWRHVTKGVDRG